MGTLSTDELETVYKTGWKPVNTWPTSNGSAMGSNRGRKRWAHLLGAPCRFIGIGQQNVVADALAVLLGKSSEEGDDGDRRATGTKIGGR